jgi:hypothetical protein
MRWMVWVLIASLSGCSFAFVNGPPPHHEQIPAFDCTESRVAPVLDTLFTALEVANFAVAADSTDQQWSDTFNGNPPIDDTQPVASGGLGANRSNGAVFAGPSRPRQANQLQSKKDPPESGLATSKVSWKLV